MKSLYNIKEEHLDLLRQIEENEGELSPEIEQALCLTQEAFQEKAISYGYMLKSFEDDGDLIDKEIDRLKALKKAKENYIEAFKQRLHNAMKEFGIEEIKTPTLKISFRKSEAVEINDESLIAAEYIEIKETKAISKTKLKAAIKEGKLVAGATLVVKDNIQIK